MVTPDDEVTLNKGVNKAGKTFIAPRDNVIFEMGIFLGKLGRKNTICVWPENVEMRILSDWAGITNVMYKYQKRCVEECMKDLAERIINAMIQKPHKLFLYIKENMIIALKQAN